MAAHLSIGAPEEIYDHPATVFVAGFIGQANLWTATLNQATLARGEGISISTIYYSGNTSVSQRANYAAKLALLTGGTGVAMVAPTTGQIAGVFAGFCSTMSSALKAVY